MPPLRTSDVDQHCPDEDAIAAFLDDPRAASNQATDAVDIERHLDRCPRCRQLVAHFVRASAPGEPAPPDDVDPVSSTMQTPDGAPPADPIRPPQRIDEYEYVRPLGAGGMGHVHLYQDTRLQRRVAIKFLRSLGPAQRERFRREAVAIARLSHPGVVAVYRAGESGSTPYLVSEYIEGQPLDRVPVPLPPAQVLAIARQLAAGLRHAHDSGVLHRDIKPANVLRAADGQVKLVDFGLAKLDEGDAPPRTRLPSSVPGVAPGADAPADPPQTRTSAGQVLGTPLYMPPEQWRGEPATPRSDLYALGATLYYLATGQPPFAAQGQGLGQLAQRVVTLDADALPLRRLAPQLPAWLATLILRCLRRDPAARPASASAFLSALRRGPYRRLWGAAAGVVGLLAGGVGLQAWRTQLPTEIAFPSVSFAMGSTQEEIQRAHAFCVWAWQGQGNPEESCRWDLYQREQPRRMIRLAPYALDTTEVTCEHYADWLNQQPLHLDEHGGPWLVAADGVRLLDLSAPPGRAYELAYRNGRVVVRDGVRTRAVSQVTWHGASRYCAAQGRRLPTEAEWEFAARGQQGRRFPWGDAEPTCAGVVFGRRGGCAGWTMGTQPVGSAAQDRTPEGVRDLGGNVAEWVADWFNERYPACAAPCDNPVVPRGDGAEVRVYRGGSYPLLSVELRGAGRGRALAQSAAADVGFRCARSLPDPQEVR